MEPLTVAIGSAPFFYQIVKDMFVGGENRRIKTFSIEQIDLTIVELDRRLASEIQEINREAYRKKGTLKAKFATNGQTTKDGSGAALVRQIDTNASLEIKELTAQAEYAKGMLCLERGKHE